MLGAHSTNPGPKTHPKGPSTNMTLGFYTGDYEYALAKYYPLYEYVKPAWRLMGLRNYL